MVRYIGAAAALLCFGCVAKPGDVVTAKEFRVVNDTGTPVGSLIAGKNGGMIVLSDGSKLKGGESRVAAMVDLDKDGNARLSLFDKGGKVRIAAYVKGDGGGVVEVTDAANRTSYLEVPASPP